MLGASDDGTYVYYRDRDRASSSGTRARYTPVATGAAADSYPPTTGTARVSADGRHLLFVSSASN